MIKRLAYLTVMIIRPITWWRSVQGKRRLARAYHLSYREAGELIETVKGIDRSLGPHWSPLMQHGVVVCVARNGLTPTQHAGLLRRLAELAEPRDAATLTIEEIAARIEAYSDQMRRGRLCHRPTERIK